MKSFSFDWKCRMYKLNNSSSSHLYCIDFFHHLSYLFLTLKPAHISSLQKGPGWFFPPTKNKSVVLSHTEASMRGDPLLLKLLLDAGVLGDGIFKNPGKKSRWPSPVAENRTFLWIFGHFSQKMHIHVLGGGSSISIILVFLPQFTPYLGEWSKLTFACFEMGGEKPPPSRLVDMKKETSERMLFRGGFCFLFVVSKRVAKDGCFQRFAKMKIDCLVCKYIHVSISISIYIYHAKWYLRYKCIHVDCINNMWTWERIHIPPNRKFGTTSTQKRVSLWYGTVPWRVVSCVLFLVSWIPNRWFQRFLFSPLFGEDSHFD